MTDIDPLVPVLAATLVDVVRFLEDCDDDEVDPDTAVKMMEGVGSVLQNLPPEQLSRLLLVLEDLARAAQDPRRREFLESFSSACGLVEEERA